MEMIMGQMREKENNRGKQNRERRILEKGGKRRMT